jgi:hypothetical protein
MNATAKASDHDHQIGLKFPTRAEFVRNSVAWFLGVLILCETNGICGSCRTQTTPWVN